MSMDKKRLKTGDELLAFFLTVKAEVHSKAPQNNTKHLPFDLLFHLPVFATCLGAPRAVQVAVLEGVWLFRSRNKKRKGCSLRLALPRGNLGS